MKEMKGHKQMGTYLMFTDWKLSITEVSPLPQIITLQSQASKLPNIFFIELEKTKILMKPWHTRKSINHPEQKEAHTSVLPSL